ncbi:hypothetical protein CONLIGDRAFT_693443 [Coniochaeta ligniaria NRRL 30616]|uniref:ubiquitinyl hydrolase 1 n=1 Tax=Coniochaeta ligniaria NRRL 30616 TaxID=1408157 RepID=A0A1J7I7D1_9PEZI|nr:hypothetical protein CONLIGDRAFT_693443 [Coniochaeta ligniaria NRRL 30616]
MTEARMDTTKESIMYMIYHVFLPPELPQTGDKSRFASTDRVLLQCLSYALDSFKKSSTAGQDVSIQAVQSTVDKLIYVTDDDGHIHQELLLEAFAELSSTGGALPIYVRAQNAAVIVRKEAENIIFEAFELALPNGTVMSTKGRLRRYFPGRAIAVPIDVFNSVEFQSTLTNTLAKMSHQEATEMKATANKAGQSHIETRDVTSPHLVTEFLMSYLEAVGTQVSVARIWKNTREEVLWSNALLPWRRSPVWLLARVAMQTAFLRLTGTESYYKGFMIWFMAEITAQAVRHDISCDILHCLISKTSRRLSKLGHQNEEGWIPTVERILHSAADKLQAIWDKIAASEPDLATRNLSALDFKKDSALQLYGLDEYIEFVRKPGSSETAPKAFTPPHLTTEFQSGTLPVLPASTGKDIFYVLAAFEDWVSSDLNSWLDTHVSDPKTCGHLSRLIQLYHATAESHYQENPENISLMLLTCLELWVACDTSAARQHPGLLYYSPEVSTQLLQSLILPLKTQMTRLLGVEDYLKQREARATRSYPSLFSKFGRENSFAVRYFATSADHQDLHAKIEKWAHKKREDKKAELSQKKKEYNRLMNLHATSECEFKDVYVSAYYRTENVHSPSCNRCSHRNKAEQMMIELDEWPLPRGECEAQAVVFELKCPQAFNDWRDATLFLNMDVLKSEYGPGENKHLSYGPKDSLSKFVDTTEQRLRLLSHTKPHVVTHRNGTPVRDATETSVCVNNGLSYEYFDNTKACFATQFNITEKIPKSCTYQLQRYKPLQDFIYRPHFRPNGPEPNLVISQQHACPGEMSLEEFKSLGTLPLGVRLQWSNILLQLSLPSIDFKKRDTTLVLLQLIRQAGPRSGQDYARDGHRDLYEESFGRQLDQALRAGLKRIKENWESHHALETFISISTRLLSLTVSVEVAEACRAYLRLCRQVALDWARKLRTMAREATVPDQRDELLRRAFGIVLVCTGTFDIDLDHLKDELHLSPESASFIECSIMIHETSHAALVSSHVVQRISIQRWQRLSYKALSLLLSEIIDARNPWVDFAIGNCWSGYHQGGDWQSHAGKTRHWVTTSTASQSDATSQIVQYNILSGELRVDGLPLSRLPPTFEQHDMYKLLFDRSAIEVMRAKMAGMGFSAMKPFRGYEVFFGLQKFSGQTVPVLQGLDLMITCRKDGQRYDLLPPRIFGARLPDYFVDKFVHWYHYDNHAVEFRPISDPWTASEDNWMLSKKDKGWVMTRRNDAFLTNMVSHTGKAISELLGSIESARHIHVIFQPSRGHLNIELPRLNLGFVLQEGSSRVMSRQFRGMYLDSNQRIKTLVGLCSKAVLRNEKNDRLVLIPDGEVSWKKTRTHIEVNIQHGSSSKVYPFELDTLLGRIVDNGTLESKLALCYLHALTAFCLPDGLTGKTGTEQALEILNSASVKSFNEFSAQNIAALEDIAKLTPRRVYYPTHLRVMQTIEWIPGVSPLSQHGQLYTDAMSLLAQAASLEFFHPRDLKGLKNLDRGDLFLIDRDLIRSSVFRASGFGAEHHTTKHDKVYESSSQNSTVRTSGERSSRYDSALRTASRVYKGLQSKQFGVPKCLADRIWHLLSTTGERMQCHPLTLPEKLVAYDAERLQDWAEFLGVHWCQIHHTLSGDRHDKFSIMMFLATVAYARDVDLAVIEVLVALFNVPMIRRIKPPEAQYFDLVTGRDLSSSQLTTTMEAHAKPFNECPEYHSPSLPSESRNATWERRENDHRSQKAKVISSAAKGFVQQWPCEILQIPLSANGDTYINMNAALASINSYAKGYWDNHRFYEYLCRIENAVKQQRINPLPGSMLSVHVPPPGLPRGPIWLTDHDMFSQQAPSLDPMISSLPQDLTCSVPGDSAATQRLMAMIARLEEQANLRHEKEYVEDLRESSMGLQAQSSRSRLTCQDEEISSLLKDNARCCEERLTRLYDSLVDGLNYKTHLPLGGIAARYNSPRVSPTFFLKQLSCKRWVGLPSSWKETIVTYGVAITTFQRAVRLLGLCGNKADLVKELLNPGHENWNPHDSPESLLIEIESGILIRPVQAEIAEQMKHPAGNDNAVMQLNMGEGKSSVIVPIVATALADGSQLVRAVVAKPQSKQMLQMLVSKVGGLCNRQIYHMPFSRSLKIGLPEAKTIAETYQECMETGGILLLQPEHILSFQLMGIETNLSAAEKAEVSKSLLNTQNFFNMHSRDIVDESDENFSVRFELVYTMGTQRLIDFSPGRWYLVQTLLRLIRNIIPTIQQELPSSVEHEHGPAGTFSRTRLLRYDAQERLCRRLAEMVCESGLPELPIARQSATLREAVLKYITEPELSPEDISAVEGCDTFWTETVKQPLLLVRGLLAGGVLAFAFGQKRWRVNYGLTPTRRPETRLAVPYRAKDSPALRSEFSHPDVVIVLTCLSYYYGGLDDKDLFTAFEHLIKLDQADNEYDEWVRDAPALPICFRSLLGINLKDSQQCIRDIFPHFRQAQAAVDFFLSRIVFPKHMKEFPHKLSASGWDIGRTRTNPTTGFSGTNDSKHLLPLSVRHLDLDEQRHTNALVLLHLLQPENTVEIMPPSSGSESSDAARLLQLVVNLDQPAQVILDVGAQVIELSNIEVAAEWLRMTASNPRKQAVVFFDDGDNLMVHDRAGRVEALQTSPYAKKLDLCFVFLDEAHTRGTELKLPQDYRALVTLGAGLTKDRLVQACMRMRKLGKGQSVAFCVPEEIRMKILGVAGKSESAEIDVSDVLIWSINETYADLRRSMPLWAAQGMRFERQRLIWDKITSEAGITLPQEEAEKFLEQEALSLEDRYKPRNNTAEADELFEGSEHNPRFEEIRGRCERFDSLKFTSAALQEEQERELSPEIEAERQVERPQPAKPEPHDVHKDVQTLVRTGMIRSIDPAFKPAFRALATISAAASYDVRQFPRDLLVTRDFARTVKLTGKNVQSDAYQRPVQWIITTRAAQDQTRMIIISPFEAQELMPEIKASSAVFLHLYAPRSNLAFRPLDDLKLYTVPSLPLDWQVPLELVLQLNLFAGQLYFRTYDEYKSACEFIGLAWRLMDGNTVVQPDGFIVPGAWDTCYRFAKSPTKFLQVLMATVRRDGRGIGKTHWGRVLAGEILCPAEFEDQVMETD